jgi:hypothetical protein
MSMDELQIGAGGGTPLETKEQKRKRLTKPMVRKHLLTTVYKKEVAEQIDKLHADGHTILSITPSNEIRGFEIISYKEE